MSLLSLADLAELTPAGVDCLTHRTAPGGRGNNW